MKSTHTYDCEIISFVVLLILSALSHFWYIMIFICAGIAVWAMSTILARTILNRMAIPISEVGRRTEYDKLTAGTLLVSDSRGPSHSCFAPRATQESR